MREASDTQCLLRVLYLSWLPRQGGPPRSLTAVSTKSEGYAPAS